MYPLNMMLATGVGFALASDIAEHIALTTFGYGPAYVPPPEAPAEADPLEADASGHTVAAVRATLDAAGVPYDKRLGLAKLIELIPA